MKHEASALRSKVTIFHSAVGLPNPASGCVGSDVVDGDISTFAMLAAEAEDGDGSS